MGKVTPLIFFFGPEENEVGNLRASIWAYDPTPSDMGSPHACKIAVIVSHKEKGRRFEDRQIGSKTREEEASDSNFSSALAQSTFPQPQGVGQEHTCLA
jgi:hypothetical protein